MENNYQTEVWCSLQIEGTHNWPNCPFEDVAYLRDPHRHIFHIKAFTRVSHEDRDVEFIRLKHQIHKYLIAHYWGKWDGSALYEFGSMSCEMIAKELIAEFELSCCEVSEDNENGARVSQL